MSSVDVFKVVLLMTLCSLNALFFVVCFVWIWQERRSPMIANRNIPSVFMHTFGLTMTGLSGAIASQIGMNCGAWSILQVACSFLNTFLAERLVLLILKFQRGMKAAQIAKDRLQGKFHDNNKNNLDLLTINAADRKIPVSKVVACIFYFISLLSFSVIIFQSSSAEDLASDSRSDACNLRVVNGPASLNYWKGYLAIFLIIVGVCMWKLRKVTENYFIKKELKEFGLVVALSIVMNFFITIMPAYAVSFILYCVVPIGVNYVCLFSVVRKATQDRIAHRTKSMSTINSVDGDRAENAKKETNFKKCSPEHLISLLQDPRTYEMFEKFMIQEFAVENVLFLKAALKFESDCLQGKDATSILELANSIYKDFIDTSARMCVNVPYNTRQRLTLIFGVTVKEVQPDLFTDAKTEILNLVVQDSLRRFLKSDLYKKVEDIDNELFEKDVMAEV